MNIAPFMVLAAFQGLGSNSIVSWALTFIIILCSITLHEWGHAWVADRLGDPLPRLYGRVTLNPAAHIDPIGTLLIPMLNIFSHFNILGWGRPVPLLLPKLDTARRDEILITAAGPAVNILTALLIAAVGGLFLHVASEPVCSFLVKAIIINFGMAAFNLLPLPPLDGGKIFWLILGLSEDSFYWVMNWSWIIILFLINWPFFWSFFEKLCAWPLGWTFWLMASTGKLVTG